MLSFRPRGRSGSGARYGSAAAAADAARIAPEIDLSTEVQALRDRHSNLVTQLPPEMRRLDDPYRLWNQPADDRQQPAGDKPND